MGPLLGLAGPAEAGLAMDAGILCLGVVVILIAAVITLVLRSQIAARGGITVWALLALLLQPWQDFSPTPSDDPDMQSFQATFRSLAWWWVAATISLILAGIRAFWPQKSGEAPARQVQVEPSSSPADLNQNANSSAS